MRHILASRLRDVMVLSIWVMFWLCLSNNSQAQMTIESGSDEIVAYVHIVNPHKKSERLAEILNGFGFQLSAFNLKSILGSRIGDPSLDMMPIHESVTLVWLRPRKAKPPPLVVILSGITDLAYIRKSAAIAKKSTLQLRGLHFIGTKKDIQRAENLIDSLINIHQKVHAQDITIYLDQEIWKGRVSDLVKWLADPGFDPLLEDMLLKKKKRIGRGEASQAPVVPKSISLKFHAMGEILKQVDSVNFIINLDNEEPQVVANITAKKDTKLALFFTQAPARSNHYVRYLPPNYNLRMALQCDTSLLVDFVADLTRKAAQEAFLASNEINEMLEQLRYMENLKNPMAIAMRDAGVLNGNFSWISVVEPKNKFRVEKQIQRFLGIGRLEPEPQAPSFAPLAPVVPQSARKPVAISKIAVEDEIYQRFKILYFFDPAVQNGPAGKRPVSQSIMSACLAGISLVISDRPKNLLSTMDYVLRHKVLQPPLKSQRIFLDKAQFYLDFRDSLSINNNWRDEETLALTGRLGEGRIQIASSIPPGSFKVLGKLLRVLTNQSEF